MTRREARDKEWEELMEQWLEIAEVKTDLLISYLNLLQTNIERKMEMLEQ